MKTKRGEQKVCIVCGQPLPKKRILYCSKRCSQLAWDRRKRTEEVEERKRREEEFQKEMLKKKLRAKPKTTFSMIIRGMEKTGLSYGEYVARFVHEE